MSSRMSVAASRKLHCRVWVVSLAAYIFFGSFLAYGAESEKWTGIDESVVKKIAKEHGREAREPLINTDQGDLLLFVFLIAGTIGGFIAGYSWRKLTERGARKEQGTKADGTLL